MINAMGARADQLDGRLTISKQMLNSVARGEDEVGAILGAIVALEMELRGVDSPDAVPSGN